MLIAPLPLNETERLTELKDYYILNTAAEPMFDEIVGLAATLCGTSFAAISLVDKDRQWFKAQHGLGISETPRDVSVCAHAILEPGIFEVPDTEEDERFVDNPLLLGAAIRFYGGAPLMGRDGNTLGMLCVLDNTPKRLTSLQRRTLAQLSNVVMSLFEAGRQGARRQWFGALVDSLQDDVMVFDADSYRCLHVSQSAMRRLGYSQSRLRRITAVDVTPSLSADAFAEYMQRLATSPLEVVYEAERTLPGGEAVPVEVRWQRIDTNGRPVIMAIVRDISERQQLDKAKQALIAVVSHEMRTPLTAIYGGIKLVESGACGTLPPAVASMISMAARNTEHLLAIVNDMLDLEKIAVGFDIRPIEVTAVFNEIAASQRFGVQAKGVLLNLDSPPGLRVMADSKRLRQILENLVSNALKFAPPGSVIGLDAHMHEGHVRLSVTDAGPGIPENFRAKIFGRFAQADMETTRIKGGSGLGLSIVKSLTENMNGHVSFDSRPGKTSMHVDLPVGSLVEENAS
ncbi:MAG: GAF domain-containing sensor histidine kinase [Pseudomonadota bacterium]